MAGSSRRIYGSAIDGFIRWALKGGRPLTKASVQQYRVHLVEAQGLAAEAADNGLLDP